MISESWGCLKFKTSLYFIASEAKYIKYTDTVQMEQDVVDSSPQHSMMNFLKEVWVVSLGPDPHGLTPRGSTRVSDVYSCGQYPSLCRIAHIHGMMHADCRGSEALGTICCR